MEEILDEIAPRFSRHEQASSARNSEGPDFTIASRPSRLPLSDRKHVSRRGKNYIHASGSGAHLRSLLCPNRCSCFMTALPVHRSQYKSPAEIYCRSSPNQSINLREVRRTRGQPCTCMGKHCLDRWVDVTRSRLEEIAMFDGSIQGFIL